MGRRSSLLSLFCTSAWVSVALGACVDACTVDRPVTGRACIGDDDCVPGANGGEFHCELAVAPPLCFPGPAGVVRRPNRAPYALDTLVVVPSGLGQQAKLQLVDPDGDEKRITSPGGQFGSGGVTASLTVLDAEEGLLQIDTSGAIEGVVPLTVSDAFDNAALIQVFVVAVDEDALVRWNGAVSSAFSNGANWDGGAPPGAGQSFLVADNGEGTFDPEIDVDIDAVNAPSEGFVLFDAAFSVPANRRLSIASRFLSSGASEGDGVLALVNNDARIGGRAPAVEIASASSQGALSALSLRGESFSVAAGTTLATAGDVDLVSLTLDAAAVVDVSGSIEVNTLVLSSSARRSPTGSRRWRCCGARATRNRFRPQATGAWAAACRTSFKTACAPTFREERRGTRD